MTNTSNRSDPHKAPSVSLDGRQDKQVASPVEVRQEEVRKDSASNDPSILYEFWQFLSHHKLWWMIPILVSLAFIGLVCILANSVVAPFIYPLF